MDGSDRNKGKLRCEIGGPTWRMSISPLKVSGGVLFAAEYGRAEKSEELRSLSPVWDVKAAELKNPHHDEHRYRRLILVGPGL